MPAPSGAAEIGLVESQDRLRARVRQLEASERRLRRLAALTGKMAARKAKLQVRKERQRLGRELHTGVGQLLAAVRIQVELIDQFLPERPAPVAQALGRIGVLAAEALEQVRAVSHDLYLMEWERMPLPDAIRSLWDRSGIAERFRGRLSLAAVPCVPDGRTKALVYRTAQEAISNVIRHSRATRVCLSLDYQDGKLLLTVEDDGVGFHTVNGGTPANGGMGLRSLREEAAALGAELAIANCSPGTRLTLTAAIAC